MPRVVHEVGACLGRDSTLPLKAGVPTATPCLSHRLQLWPLRRISPLLLLCRPYQMLISFIVTPEAGGSGAPAAAPRGRSKRLARFER